MYPTIDMEETGKRIRQIMEQKKLSVKDVKQYLNLSSVQSIYHWLNGKSLPTVDNLYALSELLRLPMDEIIVGTRKYMVSFSGNRTIKHDMKIPDNLFCVRMWVYYQEIAKANVA